MTRLLAPLALSLALLLPSPALAPALSCPRPVAPHARRRLQSPLPPVLRPVAGVLPALVAAARRYRLPASLVVAVAEAESGGDRDAVSAAGAMGPLQVTPIAAAQVGLPMGTWREQVRAGVAYLAWAAARVGATAACLRAGPWAGGRCGWLTDLALSAYNAGPAGAYQAGYVAAVRLRWPRVREAMARG